MRETAIITFEKLTSESEVGKQEDEQY